MHSRLRGRSADPQSASAEYFIRWIDKLHKMADAWPWWRSEVEKRHVFAQFDEARSIYQKLAREAE